LATQRSTFTATNLYDRVRAEIGMRGSNLLVDADILVWANEAVRQCAAESHWYRTSTPATPTAGTAEYDLPTLCIAIEEVLWDGLPIGQVSLADFYNFDPYWRSTSQGTPYCYYLRGTTKYGLYPTPDVSTANIITLYYTALPAENAGTTNTFEIPTASQRAIEAYCLYRASMKDATGEGARRVEIYQKEWLSELERLKETVANMNEAEVFVLGIDSCRPSWRDYRRQIVTDPY